MQRESELRQQAQEAIKGLIVRLSGWPDQSGDLLDIIDVLMQVDKKITTAKNPEALVNRLVNYIRSVAIKGRLHFPDEEEKLMIDLGIIGQKAGLNGAYMADFSDKSQFYGMLEEVPQH
ncbi:bacteriocin immunity protein [Lactiplantibacillus plantarum]|uniref:bacteriocin immunity protein n=1 Tax=Lactiplantibacillus plantarum TaxID=1590 RepID=UPI0028FC1E17|nr:bacteriocin immunity protein [Lactiplantibacillus plantarum]MCG0748402.1 bacteriocin immunity protein [Lactiplantibacillus plantarum]WNW15482.1 bacteriocin immunity protein [Lactiplantibacillus plantarum]WNW18456.1 bacteriocin immunity protein [Lactiplantibacillus plantarum]